MADLLTVYTVAQYLGLDEYADVQSTIEDMINAAQNVIQRIANRSLDANQERTEYYNASGTHLYVDHAPITEIINLTDDVQYSERAITLSNVIQNTDDGGRNYRRGKIELWKNEGGFCGGRLNARVNYRAGWTVATLPDDLRQAWLELVLFWYNNPQRVGLVQAAIAGETVAWQQVEVPQELMKVFKAYRLESGK